MERIIDVAQYIYEEYKSLSGEVIDEMKLHKMLYLAQRESFAIVGKQLFEGEFEGWRYGPVCREIRNAYTTDGMFAECNKISNESAYIVKNVLETYGSTESWSLSILTHNEVSWKNARRGLSSDENGSVPLKNSDIMADARKVRPYDHVWDMYYDEFDDIESTHA
jgi:uncharacterized phage-associated protein